MLIPDDAVRAWDPRNKLSDLMTGVRVRKNPSTRPEFIPVSVAWSEYEVLFLPLTGWNASVLLATPAY